MHEQNVLGIKKQDSISVIYIHMFCSLFHT